MAKLIQIKDVGTGTTYRLDGSTLEMIVAGGCRDALNVNGCKVNEKMSDDRIVDKVRAAWTEGYEGDPDDNGLTITVDDERQSI